MTSTAFEKAIIESPSTGKLLGGQIVKRHKSGDVSILFAGSLVLRGKPLGVDDIQEIEEPSTQSTPD